MNYILKNENVFFYEYGYSCDNALFLRLEDEAFFITDFEKELIHSLGYGVGLDKRNCKY